MGGLKPPITSDLAKVAFIVGYALQRCHAPWALYLELSKEPIKDLVMIVAGLDFTDFVEATFKPSGTHSGFHKRKKYLEAGEVKEPHDPHAKLKGGIPDFNEECGALINAEIDAAALNYSMGTRALFVGFAAYQGFEFTTAIVEQGTESAFETLYGVMTANSENCADLGCFGAHNKIGVWGGAGPLWKPLGYTDLDYAVACASFSGFAVGLGLGYWVVTVAFKGTADQDNSQVGIRILANDPTLRVADQVTFTGPKKNEVFDMIATAVVVGNQQIQWEISIDYGFLHAHYVSFFAVRLTAY